MSLDGDWQVSYGDLATTVIGDITEIYVRIGRVNVTDQWSVSEARIVVWYPDPAAASYLHANLSIGERIIIDGPVDPSTSLRYRKWTGICKDIRYLYGMPYDSGTTYGVGDYLIIEAEGRLAEWNRTLTDGYTVTSTNAKDAIEEVATEFDLPVLVSSQVSRVPINPTTIVGDVGTWLQNVAVTGQLRLLDGSADGVDVYLTDPVQYGDKIFSDTTNDSTHVLYDDLEFDSLSDNYYTDVTVSSDGIGSATSSLGGFTKKRYLEIDTLAATVAQCQDLADYVRQALDSATLAPSTISCKSNGQAAFEAGYNVFTGPTPFASQVRFGVDIDFRGMDKSGVIEGGEITLRPDGYRVTWNLSGAGYYSALVLNSSTNGLLNVNTLGLY